MTNNDLSDEKILFIISKLDCSISQLISEGVEKESKLLKICEKLYFSDSYNMARRILKRIQTRKFQQIFESLDALNPDKSDITGTEEGNEIVQNSAIPHYKKIANVSIPKSYLVNDSYRVLEKGQEWSQNFYEAIRNVVECSLVIKRKEIYPNKFWIICECRFEMCNLKYKFMAQNFQSSDNFEFGIFSNGDYSEDQHSSPKSRNYSGAKRSKIACDVVENGTLKVQNQILLSQDMSSLNYKNENTISTLNALKQMKHEKLAFCDFDTNDAIDISAIKELTDKMPSTPADITPSYIKYIRMDSLSVFWCCESQIDLFLRYSDRHVSVDATGNITRSTDTKRKQFYYSIVYRNMLNNEIMPVMQSICSNHDISNLSNIFNLFSRELKISSNKNNPVELITIDFSFALMNAISLAFNGCSLYLYLEQAYRKFVLNEPINLTVIASCSVHIFKFVCDKLKVCSKEAKNSIKTSFAKILLAESYNDFLNLFSNLYICLKHSKVPMNLLLSMSSNCREPCFHFDEDLANTSLDFTDFEIKSSLYMKLQCVRDIEFLVETKLNNKEQNFLTNPNVYPELATYLLRKLGPFCFLWASFCHPRKSNAIIEAHHKVIKHDLLKCTNMKTGRAIRELRVMNNAQMVKARSSNLYKPKNNQKSVKIEDPMETFKKSKAPSITVFDQIRADVEIRADVSKEISENAKIVKKINLQSLATQIFEKIYELKFESSPYTLISTISLQKRDLLLLENER